jgi:SAM-dependent methyltransferase
VKQPPGLDGAVAKYYAQAPEEDRLKYGPALLEEARTRELIQRHAPPPRPPAVVLDVGGGAGAYSFWLSHLGYTVHLVDAAPRLIAEAQRRGAGERLASSRVGDARMLDFPDAQADVVLFLGPLYHLTEAADRAKALAEAKRVLKPGGWFFGAVISRWASALDGIARDLFQDSRLRRSARDPRTDSTAIRLNGSIISPQRTSTDGRRADEMRSRFPATHLRSKGRGGYCQTYSNAWRTHGAAPIFSRPPGSWKANHRCWG